MEVVLIKTELIIPNEYNPNVVPEDIMAKLRAEIAQKGLVEPIIVRKTGDVYTIVDGFHRWQICKELGYEEIPCFIKDYSDAEAKIKTVQLNYMRGSAIPIKLASLIHNLSKDMTLSDLARRLPYEEPQLLDSLELLKLPENFGRDVEFAAREEEKEMPMVVSFVLTRRQVEILEKAIEISSEIIPDGTKNIKAVALEKICVEYIERKQVKTEAEVVTTESNTV